KEEDAGREVDGLQGAEVAVDGEADDAPESDVNGEAGRMRMLLGDVVRAHAEAEERLVPIPQRASHGREARDRADGGNAPEDEPCARAQAGRRIPREGRRACRLCAAGAPRAPP